MDYGHIYLSEWEWDGPRAHGYVAVIWSPEAGGGKAKEVWRGKLHADPADAFKEMERAAKKRGRPCELWRNSPDGGVRVGVVGVRATA